MCRNDPIIFLLRVLSIKRVRSCNWLTETVYKQLLGMSSIFFMFQNDHERLGHSVICSIDYWLLYVNRKFKWYELSTYLLVDVKRSRQRISGNPDNFTVSISFEYELERLVAVIKINRKPMTCRMSLTNFIHQDYS